jgi:hypothetical protein
MTTNNDLKSLNSYCLHIINYMERHEGVSTFSNSVKFLLNIEVKKGDLNTTQTIKGEIEDWARQLSSEKLNELNEELIETFDHGII